MDRKTERNPAHDAGHVRGVAAPVRPVGRLILGGAVPTGTWLTLPAGDTRRSPKRGSVGCSWMTT